MSNVRVLAAITFVVAASLVAWPSQVVAGHVRSPAAAAAGDFDAYILALS
jgi:hypothetical protein